MGRSMAGDDEDRPAHVWIAEELHLTLSSDDQVEQCDRGRAVRYQTGKVIVPGDRG
jgi:hypothetical protein